MVAYNNKKYYIDIVETRPSHAISIIETDCEVDFAPPLDYKEPEKPVVSVPEKAPAQGMDEHFLCFFFFDDGYKQTKIKPSRRFSRDLDCGYH